MVCSFTVTVEVSIVVVGTLILDVVVILGSVTKEPNFQQRYNNNSNGSHSIRAIDHAPR